MSLFARNLFFLILQPGTVVVLIPYFILVKWPILAHNPFIVWRLLALLLFITGLAVLVHCIWLFIRFGKGTLSPFDPTRHLVDQGIYRYTRNPMYLGVLSMLFSESLFFKSIHLFYYTLIIGIIFELFIRIHEEPRMKKHFGPEYSEYQKKVRRWF